MADKPENIVIVGGGFAGINTFNLLHAKLSKLPPSSPPKPSITLITSRPFFTHTPALVRTVVSPEGTLEDAIFHPLTADRFTQDGNRVLVGNVVSVVDDADGATGQHYVVLESGETVRFSALVLASGSIWEGPLALPDTKEEILESIRSWRGRFKNARDVVLVGGGSIGLEFAGEIKDLDPSKNVTIVHAKPLVLNEAYPDRWRRKAADGYRTRGVKFILDDYVDDIEIKEDGKVHTRAGKAIRADLVIPTRGPRPNTSFLASLTSLTSLSSSPNSVLSKTGYIKVLPTLQLPAHPRIFAAGDIIDVDEQKQAAKTGAHAAVVVDNVLSLLGLGKKGGSGKMREYKKGKELILITNGKNGGTGYAGILWGIIMGNWLARILKSKHLLVGMIKSSLQL